MIFILNTCYSTHVHVCNPKFISLLGRFLTGYSGCVSTQAYVAQVSNNRTRTQDSRSCGSGARTRFYLDSSWELRELRNSGTGLHLGITGLRPVGNYETPVENYETPVENFTPLCAIYKQPGSKFELARANTTLRCGVFRIGQCKFHTKKISFAQFAQLTPPLCLSVRNN